METSPDTPQQPGSLVFAHNIDTPHLSVYSKLLISDPKGKNNFRQISFFFSTFMRSFSKHLQWHDIIKNIKFDFQPAVSSHIAIAFDYIYKGLN